MRLKELAEGCLEVPSRFEGVEVTGITSDSCQVEPGHLFVAVCGEKVDGHKFKGAGKQTEIPLKNPRDGEIALKGRSLIDWRVKRTVYISGSAIQSNSRKKIMSSLEKLLRMPFGKSIRKIILQLQGKKLVCEVTPTKGRL